MVELDGRNRHIRGLRMRGEGERSFVLVLVLEDFVLWEECGEREGREWKDNERIQTWIWRVLV